MLKFLLKLNAAVLAKNALLYYANHSDPFAELGFVLIVLKSFVHVQILFIFLLMASFICNLKNDWINCKELC